MKQQRNFLRKFGFVWVTTLFFLISLAGHWIFAWYAFVNEQKAHQQPLDVKEYLVEVSRDTLENWQSEFLQLVWQVAGLALLLCIGSPQSKEGDDRREEKLDFILRQLDQKKSEAFLRELEKKYPKN